VNGYSGDWPVFAKRLKRILRDLSLQQRKSTLENTKYERLCAGIERRMTQLIESTWSNKEAKRLVKRLRRHRAELFILKTGANYRFFLKK